MKSDSAADISRYGSYAPPDSNFIGITNMDEYMAITRNQPKKPAVSIPVRENGYWSNLGRYNSTCGGHVPAKL
jgi:hypothetical protein